MVHLKPAPYVLTLDNTGAPRHPYCAKVWSWAYTPWMQLAVGALSQADAFIAHTVRYPVLLALYSLVEQVAGGKVLG
jgi:hypothetical protein